MRSTRRPLLKIAIGACRCGVPARQVNSALVLHVFGCFWCRGDTGTGRRPLCFCAAGNIDIELLAACAEA